MSVLSIEVNGNSVTIDSKVFTGYTQESYQILEQISELSKDFKDLVEVVAENTKLEKKDVSKYLKARFKLATKEPKIQGELFQALDEILEG